MAYSHVFDMTDQFNASDLSYWLIGGYAIELIVGKRIRDHSDVDFMVDVRDAGRMVEILSELGYELRKGSVAEGLAYYNRETEEVCVVPIDSSLDPPATVGGFKGMKFPERFLDTLCLQIDSHKIPTLQPRMHVSMKQIVSQFFGSEVLRDKDIIDIQHLADLSEV
jgi:hypothetical protein